ncbi:MAG: type II secretion system protein [Bacilli bacterium]|nr:type II secretion system protein [Bacilli bacterium]
MLRNKQGMTLVEMIVTVAVFSIVALMLATGFATVIRYMGEASAIKNTGNEIYTMIESEDSESITNKSVKIKITLENGKEIDDKISKNVVEKSIDEDDDSYKIRFTKLSKKEGYVDTAKIFYEKVKEAMEYCLANPKTWINNFNDVLKELQEQNAEMFGAYTPFTSDYLGNDQFIKYFRIMGIGNDTYPILDEKIVEKCNEIFDETKGLLSNSKINDVRMGEKPIYMKAIYVPDKSHPMVVIVADEYPYTEKLSGWRSRLVYKPDEECWYYKIHSATNVDKDDTRNYFYLFSSFSTYEQWQNFLMDLKDTSKWRKIDIN